MLKSVEEGSFTVKQYPSLNGFVKTSSPVVSELLFVCLTVVNTEIILISLVLM